MAAANTTLTNSSTSILVQEFASRPKVQLSFSGNRASFSGELVSHLQLNTASCIQLRHLSGAISSRAATQTDDMFSIFREIGLDEEKFDSLLAKNSTLRSTSLDKIHDRVLALQSVGITGFALFCLIVRCPSVLIGEEIGMLISFLNDEMQVKIEPAHLCRLFRTVEPRFLLGFEQKVKLLLHHGIPQERTAYVLNNVNLKKAFCSKSVEEIQRMMTFLEPYGGINIIVRRPVVLNYDLDTQLIPRVEFLLKLSGQDKEGTGAVVLKLPSILSYTLEHLKSQAEFLSSYAGLSDQEIFKIIQVFPNMMSASKERKLHPRTKFLKQCGLNSNEIYKFLTTAPLFLALSEDNISHKIGFLVRIGYKYKTKELTVALEAVTRTSCENMQKVISLFLSYGFSCADILAMSKKHPRVLQYNPSSLEEKMEYLVEEMGRETNELLSFPAFLGYKLDDRIKHRFEVKKKTRGKGMALSKLLTMPTDMFLTRNKEDFVLPIQD